MEFPKSICDECINKLQDISVLIETFKCLDFQPDDREMTKKFEEEVSFQRFETCRICSCQGKLSLLEKETNLALLFRSVTNFDVKCDIHFANNFGVCNTCIEKLGDISSFINLSFRNDKKFGYAVDVCDFIKTESCTKPIDTDLLTCNDLKLETVTDANDSLNESYIGNDSFVRGIKKEDETINIKIENDVLESRASTSQTVHLHNSCNEEKPFRCDCCEKSFIHKGSLYQHMLTHTGEKHFQCDRCEKSYTFKHHLQEHILKWHDGEKLFECDFCEQSFIDKSSLHQHMLTHTGEKHFECDRCEKSFTFKHHLQEHILKWHDGEKRFKCDFCQRPFPFERLLVSYRLGTSFKCKSCYQKTSDMKSILRDRLQGHSAEKLYKCECCKKSFKYFSGLRQHMLFHSGGLFACDRCEKSFARALLPQQHLIPTGEETHMCTFCKKSYGRSAHLQQHQSTHTGDMLYKCECCDKSYKLYPSLRTHRLTHLEKRYKCDCCPQRFTQSSILRRHMLSHTGEKPYSCDRCKKRFSRKYLLTDHMDIHITEKVRSQTKFPNGICGECLNKLEDIKVFIETLKLIDVKSEINSIPKNEIECTKVKEIEEERGMIKIRTKEFKEEVSIQDLETCRSCSCPGKLTLLEKKTNLTQLLRRITNVDVVDDVLFAIKFGICNSCIEKLEDISSFINSSVYNDKKIEYAIDRCKPIKTEICASPLDTELFPCNDLKLVTEYGIHFEENSIVKEEHEIIDIPKQNDVHEFSVSALQVCLSQKSGNEKKQFHCDCCEKTFSQKDNLHKHMLTHTGEKHFECDRCERSFTFKHHLQEHMLKFHNDKKQFKCEFCETPLSFEFVSMSYKRGQLRDMSFKCKFCEHSFSENSSLRERLMLYMEERPHECKRCDKRYKYSSGLQQHMITHSGEKRFECDRCTKRFFRSSILQRHMLSHTKEKPYKCHFCEQSFSRSEHLQQHELKHTGEKRYICELCEICFDEKQTFRKHMLTHREKRFKCNCCEMKFCRPAILHRHMLTHSGERPYKCEQCDKSFPYRSGLQTHMLRHTGERPYKCDFCDSSFGLKSSLRRHSMIHTGEKQFDCDVCGRSFKWKNALKRHMNTHSAEK